MDKAPSTIYNVVHRSGRNAELEITDSAMRYANGGRKNYRRMVCTAFRDAIEEKEGQNLGLVEFGDLDFDVIRAVRAVKPKISACGCNCVQCGQDHCRKKNSGCNVW